MLLQLPTTDKAVITFDEGIPDNLKKTWPMLGSDTLSEVTQWQNGQYTSVFEVPDVPEVVGANMYASNGELVLRNRPLHQNEIDQFVAKYGSAFNRTWLGATLQSHQREGGVDVGGEITIDYGIMSVRAKLASYQAASNSFFLTNNNTGHKSWAIELNPLEAIRNSARDDATVYTNHTNGNMFGGKLQRDDTVFTHTESLSDDYHDYAVAIYPWDSSRDLVQYFFDGVITSSFFIPRIDNRPLHFTLALHTGNNSGWAGVADPNENPNWTEDKIMRVERIEVKEFQDLVVPDAVDYEFYYK